MKCIIKIIKTHANYIISAYCAKTQNYLQFILKNCIFVIDLFIKICYHSIVNKLCIFMPIYIHVAKYAQKFLWRKDDSSMKKILNKGKAVVSYISVLSILAVTLLSVFTGTAFVSSAADEIETVVTYPISGSYDADVVIKEGGITYTDVSSMNKTEVSNFTAFDTTFWLTAEGNGTAANPFIIKTANQFAAVATNNLVYDENVATTLDVSRYSFITVGDDKILNTTGLTFKVADNVKAFNMNNTDSNVDFSGDMTAEQVKTALESATVTSGLGWEAKTAFKGRFDGNGVVIYGLKAYNSSNSGLFPNVAGLEIRNVTLKNSFFRGDAAGGLVGACTTPDGVSVRNCAVLNNYILVNRLNDSDAFGGVVLGKATSNADSGWMSGAFVMVDSLVAGNIAKHTTISTDWKGDPFHNNEYDFTYGVFPSITYKDGAVVTNSIVLDSAPYSTVWASRGFYESDYTSVYTNMLDITIDNTHYKDNGATKVNEVTKIVSDGTKFNHEYHYYLGGSDSANYSRVHEAGTLIKIDAAATKGTNVKNAMPDLDWSKWTVNEDGYPTPKVYGVREYSAGEAWTGDVAIFYSGGNGTSSSPYIINTAEEFVLMLTTANPGECFALGADIILNDTSAADWTVGAKQWFTSNDVPTFEGLLDGNGHSVSGIYYSGNQRGESAGLIPVIGSGATIENLTVKDSVLNGTSNMTLGAVAGSIDDMGAQVIQISTVIIEDTVKFEGSAVNGGIIGKVGYSAVKISDCISKSAGLFNYVTGQANIKRSISVGAYPFVKADFIKAEGIYTDTAGLTVDGVTVVANADMKGDAAATSMPGLNIPTSWTIVAGDYPVATGAVLSADGAVGEVWSGSIASGFAGGNGTEENPWIIETAEQLALCVYNTGRATPDANSGTNTPYYKLAADIYLNDVEGNLWKDKVGCVEWFTQRTVKNYSGTKGMTFDGDGYVVHGLYLNNKNGTDYYRAGLFPTLYEKCTIKNVGLSNAYIIGNPDLTNDVLGGIAGNMGNWIGSKDNSGNYVYQDIIDLIISYVGQEEWDNTYIGKWNNPSMPTHDSNATKAILANPIVAELVPVIENCFVDHNSTIDGRTVGGLIGYVNAPIIIKNCSVTASVTGKSEAGAFIGNDASYSSVFEGSLALTQTCTIPAMGVSHSDWRATPEYRCTQAINTYYFAIQRTSNTDFKKIAKPESRVGEAAKAFMTGLDWAGDSEDGTNDVWTVIEDGTPLQTIFVEKHTPEQYEKYSNKEFSPPEVMVSFFTGADEIELDPIYGTMYSKMSLPEITRHGYKFTGWYAFEDLSVKYPYDYFPPRDLTLFAGWEPLGVIQDFEDYPDTIWDYDDTFWTLNKPGATGGYKNEYVRTGAKSMHLLGNNSTPSDCLLNYEQMLVPGASYTLTFWVTTDKADNPATLISLVHNSAPDYLNTAVAMEDVAVVTGLTVGEWTQYSYSFTAKTKWASLRASGNSSLWFDDIIMASLDDTISGNPVINLGTGGGSATSPNTGNSVSIAVLISAIMACAIIAVVSKRNLVETIED